HALPRPRFGAGPRPPRHRRPHRRTLARPRSGLAAARAIAARGSGGHAARRMGRAADAADGLPDPPLSRRLTVGGGGRLGWRTFARDGAERTVLHAALRLDRQRDRLRWASLGGAAASETRRTLVASQLGVRWTARAGLELRANLASAARAPDLLELF